MVTFSAPVSCVHVDDLKTDEFKWNSCIYFSVGLWCDRIQCYHCYQSRFDFFYFGTHAESSLSETSFRHSSKFSAYFVNQSFTWKSKVFILTLWLFSFMTKLFCQYPLGSNSAIWTCDGSQSCKCEKNLRRRSFIDRQSIACTTDGIGNRKESESLVEREILKWLILF